VAKHGGLRLGKLDVLFKNQMGATVTQYVKSMRLDRAAILLATTNMSVKEVWASVGFNHHSNFDHDFKNRFHRSPREYRTLVLRPAAKDLVDSDGVCARQVHGPGGVSDDLPQKDGPCNKPGCVLIVDGDNGTRTTLATFLRGEGHRVYVETTGTAAIATLERVSPEAILLDYHLDGEMNGLECLRHVRRRVGNNVSGVALFTADWDIFECVDEVKSLNASIVSKLCDLEQVAELVRCLSRQSTNLSSAISIPWWR
jgi:CheY-like chemotaxis protein